jgi:hypothetical protein
MGLVMKRENNFVKYTSIDDGVIDFLPEKRQVNCKVCEENHLDHKKQTTKSILIIIVGIVTLIFIVLLEQGLFLNHQAKHTQLNATNWNETAINSTNDR